MFGAPCLILHRLSAASLAMTLRFDAFLLHCHLPQRSRTWIGAEYEMLGLLLFSDVTFDVDVICWGHHTRFASCILLDDIRLWIWEHVRAG